MVRCKGQLGKHAELLSHFSCSGTRASGGHKAAGRAICAGEMMCTQRRARALAPVAEAEPHSLICVQWNCVARQPAAGASRVASSSRAPRVVVAADQGSRPPPR